MEQAMEKAIEAVTAAAETLEREKQRLEETNAEVERITRQIEETDPDDEKAFAKLVAARDAARGRVEALGIRVKKATAAVTTAEAAQRALEARQRADHLAVLLAELQERDAAITREVLEFRATLLEKAGELRRLVLEVNGIQYPDGGALRSTDRGLRWGGGVDVMRVAANLPAHLGVERNG